MIAVVILPVEKIEVKLDTFFYSLVEVIRSSS